MDLPDDVAVMTSSHHGKVLGEVHWIWGRWIEATGEEIDILFVPMIDACDELQSSVFNAIHGYYGTSFSCLRNVLELMTIATCGALRMTEQYRQWQTGSSEYGYGYACRQLSDESLLREFNTRMRASDGISLWDRDKASEREGYARRLYRELCNYAHSRRGFTDSDLRKSNGPIFVQAVFWNWYIAYLQTVSLCSILMFLARPNGDRRIIGSLFARDSSIICPELMHARKLVALNSVLGGLRRKSSKN
jgi:hypothetical protein